MDLLGRTDLERLSSLEHAGTHVSMFMPTHRLGGGVEADRLRWKNALSAVESVLADRGMRRPDIEELLAPGWALHQSALTWPEMSDGLVMYLRPGWQQTFRVPVEVPELSTVGDRFVISPLLPLLSGDEHFLLLAVSQRKVRLLEGTRYTVEEVVLPEVPASLRDVVEPPEPRSHTMARPASPGGRGGPAVFYGHGAADDHWKKDEIERFLRQVSAGLDTYLAGQQLPLVLFGLEHLVSIYRDVTDYPHLLDEDVRTNPDPLSTEELHAAAWPVVEQRLAADKRRIVERFEELHGTGMALTDLLELREAAAHGRIDTLLIAAQPSCWAQASPGSPRVVELGADEASARCEAFERLTVDTLTHGGDIYTFSDTPVPGGGDVAALLRY